MTAAGGRTDFMGIQAQGLDTYRLSASADRSFAYIPQNITLWMEETNNHQDILHDSLYFGIPALQ